MTPDNDPYVIAELNKIIQRLEQEVKELRDNGIGRPGIGDWCKECKEHKVSLPSKNKKICSCGLSDFPLKKGQKSVLENKTGV